MDSTYYFEERHIVFRLNGIRPSGLLRQLQMDVKEIAVRDISRNMDVKEIAVRDISRNREQSSVFRD